MQNKARSNPALQDRAVAAISVVIPVHSREHLIARAVDSVATQSLAVREIIVVDDASTDHTADVVDGLARSLSNLTLIRLEKNSGASRARNAGIEVATGDLVAFLDSDDVWHPEKLRLQVDEYNAGEELVGVFCGIEAVSVGTGVRQQFIPKAVVSLSELYDSNSLMSMSCALVSKKALETIGGFDEALPTCEDWDLFIRLAEIGKMSVVQKALVQQMMHEGHRLSRDRSNMLIGLDALYEKNYKRASDERQKRMIRAAYEMRMADILSTDYCFAPLSAIRHSCKGFLLAPSRNALHNLRHVVKSSCKNMFARS